MHPHVRTYRELFFRDRAFTEHANSGLSYVRLNIEKIATRRPESLVRLGGELMIEAFVGRQ